MTLSLPLLGEPQFPPGAAARGDAAHVVAVTVAAVGRAPTWDPQSLHVITEALRHMCKRTDAQAHRHLNRRALHSYVSASKLASAGVI